MFYKFHSISKVRKGEGLSPTSSRLSRPPNNYEKGGQEGITLLERTMVTGTFV